jgi:hypothetical protein
MGRQINFFLHPDDQTDFNDFLMSFDDFTILPYYHFDNKVSTINDTILRDIKTEGAKVYLIRTEDLIDIPLRHIEKFNYWLIEAAKLPVIEFGRCILRENKIMSGRLYFQTHYYEGQDYIQKSERFINWADKIIKSTRRKLIKHKDLQGNYTYTYYFGELAMRWYKDNKAEIGGAGHELISIMVNENK